MIRMVRSAIRTFRKNILRTRKVREFCEKHPRVCGFVRKRLTADETFGLHLTVGIITAFICVAVFFNILEDVLTKDPLIQYDIAVINLIQIFRTQQFTNVMLFVTYLGQWQVILLGITAMCVYLASLRRWHAIVVLILSTGIGELLVLLTKFLIKRPRPILVNALATESGFGFPSGHSFVAVSFYGLLTYFLYQKAKRKLTKVSIVFLGCSIVSAIGFSRVYLGVHWPSDVFASYFLATSWLVILITILETRKRFRSSGGGAPYVRKPFLPVFACSLFLFWAWNFAYFYRANPLIPSGITFPRSNEIGANEFPATLFEKLPRHSEDITGDPTEPIDLIIVGGEPSMDGIFQEVGWTRSDSITFNNVSRAVYRTLTNRSYPTAPGIPTYWNHKPNDFSFVKPDEKESAHSRHHVHMWRTPFLYEGKTPIWFGTAHFDKAVKLKSAIIIPTHTIDRLIDKERDHIRDDFLKTEIVERMTTYQIVEPTSGKNIVGDHFYTDGKAYVFFLQEGDR
ncbi:MAG: LssY C-terminal domain-containing protein [bacterium]|nr:LssY C-terminal domain-containing protein [bacterium]